MSTTRNLRAMQSAINRFSALLTPRAPLTVCNASVRQSSGGGFSSQLTAPLEQEFTRHGVRAQAQLNHDEIGKAMARDLEALKCKTAQ